MFSFINFALVPELFGADNIAVHVSPVQSKSKSSTLLKNKSESNQAWKTGELKVACSNEQKQCKVHKELFCFLFCHWNKKDLE